MASLRATEYFNVLPETVEIVILGKLDFESLLKSRLVTSHWNELICSEFLIKQANLNIQMDNSKVCKKFKKGQWKDNIVGLWEEISVLYPPVEIALSTDHFFSWGQKNSSFRPFQDVKKLTLYEGGNGSFTDFMQSMMPGMPKIRSVQIRQDKWIGPNLLYGTSVTQQFWKFPVFHKGWRKGMKTLSKISAFRISIFERIATMIFLRALIIAKPPLVTLELDFSKNYGLPFPSMVINEIYQTISELIMICKETLEYLRIKWDHRVETDKDLVDYARELDPFLEFILMLSSNQEGFHSLRLKLLMLNFPIISFFSSGLVNDTLVPFLKSQEKSLQRVCLSRVRWDSSVQIFKTKFDISFQNRFEFGIFMVDIDAWMHTRFKLFKTVRMIDFHAVATTTFDLNSINARKVRSRRTGTVKWTKQIMGCLRFRNSVTNDQLEAIHLREMLECFRCLQDLELIDHDGDNPYRQYSNIELNNIFLMLPRLKSLKISNLQRISDAGLSRLSELDIHRMKETGVCYPQPDLKTIPITQCKSLKYLEFRDLSSNVTDISIYLVLQFIPRLEKIAVCGNHKITEWGQSVLVRRFRRNPLFAISLKCSKYKEYMCDFP